MRGIFWVVCSNPRWSVWVQQTVSHRQGLTHAGLVFVKHVILELKLQPHPGGFSRAAFVVPFWTWYPWSTKLIRLWLAQQRNSLLSSGSSAPWWWREKDAGRDRPHSCPSLLQALPLSKRILTMPPGPFLSENSVWTENTEASLTPQEGCGQTG